MNIVIVIVQTVCTVQCSLVIVIRPPAELPFTNTLTRTLEVKMRMWIWIWLLFLFMLLFMLFLMLSYHILFVQTVHIFKWRWNCVFWWKWRKNPVGILFKGVGMGKCITIIVRSRCTWGQMLGSLSVRLSVMVTKPNSCDSGWWRYHLRDDIHKRKKIILNGHYHHYIHYFNNQNQFEPDSVIRA